MSPMVAKRRPSARTLTFVLEVRRNLARRYARLERHVDCVHLGPQLFRAQTMNAVTHPSHRSAATLTWIAFGLLIVGGLNWGLVGLFGFDLVAAIFGSMSPASRIVYVLVGVAAAYCAFAVPALARRTASPI